LNIGWKLAELHEHGFCVLEAHFPPPLIEACRHAFWPVLLDHLSSHFREPNRGPHRHFLPMPFDPPCFAPEFFFDPAILAVMRAAMDDRIVADQLGLRRSARRIAISGAACRLSAPALRRIAGSHTPSIHDGRQLRAD